MKLNKELAFAAMGVNGGDHTGEHYEKKQNELQKPQPSSGGGVSSWNDLTDKPFGRVFTEVLPTTKLEMMDGSEMDMPGIYLYSIESSVTPANNATYKVVVNGTVFEGTTKTVDANMMHIGNGGLIGIAEDTGEPFVIMVSDITESGNPGISLSIITYISDVTMNIMLETIELISNEYFPDVPTLDLSSFALQKNDTTHPGEQELLEIQLFLNQNYRRGMVRVHWSDGSETYMGAASILKQPFGHYELTCICDAGSYFVIVSLYIYGEGITLKEKRIDWDSN